MNTDSEFYEVIGDIQHEVFLVVNTTGMRGFSVIFSCLDANNNPINFNNEKYKIYVSHDAYDEPDPDPYSYYNVMLAPEDKRWIHVKDVPLGTTEICHNGFNDRNAGDYLNPIHFKYVKLLVPEIVGKKVKIVASSR